MDYRWRPAAVSPVVKWHDVFCGGGGDMWGLSLEGVAVHFNGSSWTEISIPGDVPVWTVWANEDIAKLTSGRRQCVPQQSTSVTLFSNMMASE
jgi:hypothetical protein